MSYMANPIRKTHLSFFSPVLDWLKTYLLELNPGTSVSVDMDIVYFNSSSSKVLMNIFDNLEEAANRGIDVSIVWRHHVENEISMECGQEFAEEIVAASFLMQAYEDAS